MKQFSFTYLILLFILNSSAVFAQPANDDCSGAVTLPQNGSCIAGTTVAATDGWIGSVGCQASANAGEVWYTFVATGTQAAITITQGSMTGNVELILASSTGACAGLGVAGDYCGAASSSIIFNGLSIGTTYYLTINCTGTNGTFNICNNVTTPPPTPGQDCTTAQPLCQASGFSVANVAAGQGSIFGNTSNENLSALGCLLADERRSQWYVFSVNRTGTVEFLIDPITDTDDYDWAIYDITTSNCALTPGGSAAGGATQVACNFSGCAGNTGILNPSIDPCTVTNFFNCANSPSSCQAGDVAQFSVAPPTLTAGRRYALVIDNFSASPNGFNYSWGATQTVDIGPNATFSLSMDATCRIATVGRLTNYTGANMSYLWNFGDGFTTTVAVPSAHTYASAGAYIITLEVTDANGCSETFSRIVNIPTTNVASTANVSCNGGANGAVSINVVGGTPNYTFAWNTGATTQNLTGVAAGVYNITTTDATGCTASSSATVTQPTAVTSSVASTSNVTSCTVSNGSININRGGGTAPYTFIWSNGATTQNVTGLGAGSYSVTVRDANSCSSTISSISISQPSSLSASVASSTNILCNSAATGAINITQTGGTPSYFYTWSNGATTQNLTGLNAGSYSVTVRDANSCSFTVSGIVLSQPSAVSVSNTSSNATCNGASNGFINTTPSGGTAGYTFVWSNGATSQNVSGLSAGSYSVTVRDANSCSVTMNNISISQPSAVSVSNTSSNATCNGTSNGFINTTPSGGTAGYTFVWSNGATTQNVSGLAAGSYSVTVRDANSCSVTMNNISISQPSAVSVSNTSSNATCNGTSNGFINTTPSGGTAGYTFVWNNGATTQNVSGLAAGSYSVTVRDANSCSTTIPTISIAQPSAITVTNAPSNTSCNGGANGFINTTQTGGTAGYTFVWSNGATTQNVSGLAAGSYSVTVRDANSCLVTMNNISIAQPSAITVTNAPSNTSCNGGANGFINTTQTGGTAGYTFVWSNGATTQNVSGLAAGSYSVTVRDANSCSVTMNNISISQPSAVSASLASTSNVTSCTISNGSISINRSGGTAPYTFAWSNGTTTQNATGLGAGSYSVTVRDANSCSVTLSNISISQPSSISASVASSANATCNGASNGFINTTPSGGTPAYNFVWSNGATSQNVSGLAAGSYSLTVQDASSCSFTISGVIISQPSAVSVSNTSSNATCNGTSNGFINTTPSGGTAGYTFVWSNGATSQNVSGLAAGSYSITVRDANSCSVTMNNISISQPSAVSVSNTSSNATCNGTSNGFINTTPSGGAAGYTFVWSNGATSQNITGLAAGSYSVTVRDANSCSVTMNNISISQPSAVSVSNTSSNISCNGGANGFINTTPSGGAAGYTFVWSNGATSQNVSGLAVGNYTVTVQDANGCSAVSNVVTISQPTAISISTGATTNATCGQSDGTITIVPSGGTAGYTFVWSNGATTQNLAAISAGTYTLTLTDNNGCNATHSVSITQVSNLAISLARASNVSCFAYQDAVIETAVIGGTTPYTFVWTNGATTQNLSGVGAGVYNVVVTDQGGCTATIAAAITVIQPSDVNLTVTPIVPSIACDLLPTGELDATATGGLGGGYTYLWSNGATAANNTNLAANSYSVTVSDGNGCTATGNGVITAPIVPTVNPFIVQAGTTSTTITAGNLVVLDAGSNVSGVAYAWTVNNPTTATIANAAAAQTSANPTEAITYVFTVTASQTTNGITCTDRDVVQLVVLGVQFTGMPNAFTPNADGENDFFRPVDLDPRYIEQFSVFNRWGEMLYNDAQLTGGGWDGNWKGSAQARDVYIYTLRYKLPTQAAAITLRGEFTLVR